MVPHSKSPSQSSFVRLGTCSEKPKDPFLLWFRPKQQSQRGPRTRPGRKTSSTLDVPGALIPLPRCSGGAAANRHRTVRQFQPRPFHARLHAALAGGSDRCGPQRQQRRPDGRKRDYPRGIPGGVGANLVFARKIDTQQPKRTLLRSKTIINLKYPLSPRGTSAERLKIKTGTRKFTPVSPSPQQIVKNLSPGPRSPRGSPGGRLP